MNNLAITNLMDTECANLSALTNSVTLPTILSKSYNETHFDKKEASIVHLLCKQIVQECHLYPKRDLFVFEKLFLGNLIVLANIQLETIGAIDNRISFQGIDPIDKEGEKYAVRFFLDKQARLNDAFLQQRHVFDQLLESNQSCLCLCCGSLSKFNNDRCIIVYDFRLISEKDGRKIKSWFLEQTKWDRTMLQLKASDLSKSASHEQAQSNNNKDKNDQDNNTNEVSDKATKRCQQLNVNRRQDELLQKLKDDMAKTNPGQYNKLLQQMQTDPELAQLTPLERGILRKRQESQTLGLLVDRPKRKTVKKCTHPPLPDTEIGLVRALQRAQNLRKQQEFKALQENQQCEQLTPDQQQEQEEIEHLD